jgi:hypothetical protein
MELAQQNQYGSITISMTSLYVSQGTRVSAEITVKVNNDYQGSKIFFRIKGTEKCKSNLSKQKGKRIITRSEWLLKEFPENQIKEGITLPIALDLPNAFPPSIELSGFAFNLYDLKISYKIEVHIPSDQPTVKAWKKTEKFFILPNERVPPADYPPKTKFDLVKKCCCIGYSTCSSEVEVSLDKRFFCDEDNGQIVIKINNSESGKDITRVFLQVRDSFEGKSESGETWIKNHTRLNLINQKFVIPSGLQNFITRKLGFVVTSSTDSINSPKSIFNSTKGENVVFSSDLVLSFLYNGGCNPEIASVIIPITMCHKRTGQPSQDSLEMVSLFNFHKLECSEARNYNESLTKGNEMMEPFLPKPLTE